MKKEDANPQNGVDRAVQTDSDILIADDGGEILTDGGEDLVTIERKHAETLFEAAGSLRDDIASGRIWGRDDEQARENAAALDEAFHWLRDRLRSTSRDGQEIGTDGGTTAMLAHETRVTIRVECWTCEREFFIPMGDRGDFDRCPYCGNQDGLGVQGRTFEVSSK